MKKLVVFDLDGTLHHTEWALAPSIAAATSDVTGEAPPDYKQINALYGEPIEVFCRVLVGKEDSITFNKFMDRVKYHQRNFLPSRGKLYPGISEMLIELTNNNFDLAVLSNAHLDYIILVTETLKIRKFFKFLVGRDALPSKTERLARLSATYDKTIMVGDRYHDIQAGFENEIPTIACSYGYGLIDEYKGAYIANTASEVAKIILSFTL